MLAMRATGPGRRWVLGLLVLVFVLALSGCGGDDDEAADTQSAETQAAAETTEGADSGSSEIVAQAQQVIEDAKSGLVYFPGSETDITLDKIEAVDGWKGPTATPTPPTGKKVTIIACLFGTGCEDVSRGAEKAAKALGWEVKVVDAKGTPQTYNTTFQAAIAEKPDGIITAALPASQVADKIAQAREAGIKTVGTAAIPEGIPDEYDVYVQLLEAFSSQMQAWYAIADSGGTAKVVLFWDYGYPHLVQGAEEALEVLESCSGCEVLEVRKRELATAADPVAMQKITNSLIQKYGDDLEYILTPYGFAVAPVIEAVRAAGRTDIKVLSKNAEVQNLGAVAKGEQAVDFGAPIEWAGWAAVDQMIRLFADEEPTQPWEQGMGVHAFVRDNAPADGKVDWTQFVDYEAEYRKLWGVEEGAR